MSNKQLSSSKFKTFFKQVKTGFQTNKSIVNYSSSEVVHDIFRKKTTTTS